MRIRSRFNELGSRAGSFPLFLLYLFSHSVFLHSSNDQSDKSGSVDSRPEERFEGIQESIDSSRAKREMLQLLLDLRVLEKPKPSWHCVADIVSWPLPTGVRTLEKLCTIIRC